MPFSSLNGTRVRGPIPAPLIRWHNSFRKESPKGQILYVPVTRGRGNAVQIAEAVITAATMTTSAGWPDAEADCADQPAGGRARDRRRLADAADRSLWEGGRDIALELDMSEKHLIAAHEVSVQ